VSGKSLSILVWTIPNYRERGLKLDCTFQTLCHFVPNLRARIWKKYSAVLQKSLKDTEGDAIIDNASDDIRVYRRGKFPAVVKTAAKRMLADEEAKTSRTPLGAGNSTPMDLAYDYGEYTSEGDHAMEHGIYLCVWRLESDGAWKIALDLQKSAPAEKND
jgi:hypothetical protein